MAVRTSKGNVISDVGGRGPHYGPRKLGSSPGGLRQHRFAHVHVWRLAFMSTPTSGRASLLGLCFCAGLLVAPLASAQSERVEARQSEPAVAQAFLETTLEQADTPAQASDTTAAPSGATAPIGLGALLVKDTEYVLTAPARWDREEWRRAAWISGAVLGAGLLLDRPTKDASQRNRSSGLDRLTQQFEPFGGKARSALILAGFYGFGALANDQRAIDVAQDGLAASLIASGLITPTLQFVVGRSRPSSDLGAAHFKPFSLHNESFPSGHSTQAFAMASVIASHYSEVGWVQYAAYGTASLVGLSRIYHNAHFTSDVLAGAAIGTLVGTGVVGFNSRQRDGRSYSIMPAVTAGRFGLAVQATF